MAYEFSYRVELVCMSSEHTNEDLDTLLSPIAPDVCWEARESAYRGPSRSNVTAVWAWTVDDHELSDEDSSENLNIAISNLNNGLAILFAGEMPPDIVSRLFVSIQIFSESHAVWSLSPAIAKSLMEFNTQVYVELYCRSGKQGKEENRGKGEGGRG